MPSKHSTQKEENESQVNALQLTARGVCAMISSVCVNSCVLALYPCVNAIFKPEKGEGGIPSSTGFLRRSCYASNRFPTFVLPCFVE